LVSERDLSALVVLHDLNLASTFTDHLLFLFDGKVVAQGSPEEVLNPELLQQIYGENVTTFPRPDNGGRPAILPRNGHPAKKIRRWAD
jgi:iron complex transport system ATP-binding protein